MFGPETAHFNVIVSRYKGKLAI